MPYSKRMLRLDLKDLEDDVDGIPNLRTHDHFTTYTVAGTAFTETGTLTGTYS